MDYSIYRLNSNAEIDALLAKHGQRFMIFVNGVYKVLMEMKPGDLYEFELYVKPENRELFVKVACMFINDQKENDYVFTQDWNAVRRLEPFQPAKSNPLPWHRQRRSIDK
jgi:hypothetical protein